MAAKAKTNPLAAAKIKYRVKFGFIKMAETEAGAAISAKNRE